EIHLAKRPKLFRQTEPPLQAVLISISAIDLNETFDRLGQLGNSLLDDMEAVSKSPCAILLRMPRMLRQGTLTCDCANPGSSREFGLRASSDHWVMTPARRVLRSAAQFTSFMAS
ncbi:hypothetical protein, partial [Martelella sp. AMO21009]